MVEISLNFVEFSIEQKICSDDDDSKSELKLMV